MNESSPKFSILMNSSLVHPLEETMDVQFQAQIEETMEVQVQDNEDETILILKKNDDQPKPTLEVELLIVSQS